MPDQTTDATPDPEQPIDVIYPDGRHGTMSARVWRERDPALGIRRANADQEADPSDIVNEVTPTNEPEE